MYAILKQNIDRYIGQLVEKDMICTFFGHRDASIKIESTLKSFLEEIIQKEKADIFYIGSQGDFDFMAKRLLIQLKNKYPHIKIIIALAYMPKMTDETNIRECIETIYPDGLEYTPRRYAIDRRNRWLVEHSDLVITYVTRNFGGAAKFKALAISKGKRVIEISEK